MQMIPGSGLWGGLLLLEVFFDELSFSQQVRDESLVGFDKAAQRFDVCGEFFREPLMLLVPPGLPKVTELAADDSRFFAEFFVEASQQLGEASKFAGVDDGLGHGEFLVGRGGLRG